MEGKGQSGIKTKIHLHFANAVEFDRFWKLCAIRHQRQAATSYNTDGVDAGGQTATICYCYRL